MTPGEVLYRLGDLLAHIGPERREEAESHFRKAIEENENNAGALAGMGNLLIQGAEFDQAAPFLERSVAMDDENYMTHYYLASNQWGLFRRAEEDDSPTSRRLLESAREHYLRSMVLNPHFASSFQGYGITFLFEEEGGDFTLGIQAMLRARMLKPTDSNLAYELFLLYLKAGEVDAAKDLEETFLRRAFDEALAERAWEALLRYRLDEASELFQKGDLEEGLTVIEEVMVSTGDEPFREELNRRAVEVRALIRNNRAVDLYNRAVDAAKERDYALAEKFLSEALEFVVDPDLRLQAEDFRGNMRELQGLPRESPAISR
ncbi:MAG: tetratricopeptide repeat protein [Candidatus Eisenbacteria bacterium]